MNWLLNRDIFKKSGFLSTEDKEAPGNYGLLDQTLAIKYKKFDKLQK